MFLSVTSVIVIMRVGRWSSEAFLEYIRDQVESFTKGVSKRMLEVEEFFTLNTQNPVSNMESSSQDNTIINEDSQDSVSLIVKFSEIVLNSEKELNK